MSTIAITSVPVSMPDLFVVPLGDGRAGILDEEAAARLLRAIFRPERGMSPRRRERAEAAGLRVSERGTVAK
ncbi:hypothetical protein ACIRCZ_18675 [Leifsonia sp. NPDC102414]|uniref:hypothetical protein n=1 Tax=Leifsonia sp. NPDC102414 TaxID=3364124 RepID=UPI003804E2AF